MVIGTVENPPLQGTVADMLALKGTTIYAVAPDATVYEAIERMDEWHVGALLVMRGDELVGIVSERDYTRKVILLGRSSKETLVEEIMTTGVIALRSVCGMPRMISSRSRKRVTARNRQPEMNTAPRQS